MATVLKLDSNVTGLRYAEEESLKTLPTTPVWYPLEPNSYGDFGGEITTVARTPINPSRQRKKGVTTDLKASGSIVQDLTQEGLQDILQGFLWDSLATKDELPVATVSTTLDDYQPASGGDGYVAGDLLFAKGFDSAANNGLKLVMGIPGASSVPVTTNLVTAATQKGTISRVGFQFASADAHIDVSGALPELHTTTKDFTDFGLIPGEWIFIGGDVTAEKFATVGDNGFARVRSVTAHVIVLDKTQATFGADAGAGVTLRIFFGRTLKNGITRRTYQLERDLGAPDDESPDDHQFEYLVGSVPNDVTINVKEADKVTLDMSFVACDSEQVDSGTGEKTGDRPAIVESDAFNTSSDFSRIKLALCSSTDEAPDALFAFVKDITIVAKNGVKESKGVGVLGAFDTTAGDFEVSGSMTAYFADVAAVAAVRDNADVTVDVHLAKANQGITIDLPLVALGDGRPKVEKDAEIMLPIKYEAATGAKVYKDLDHTMMIVFWDYLPNAAM